MPERRSAQIRADPRSVRLGERGEDGQTEAISHELLDGDREAADRTLDVHVSRLRKKLGDGGAQIVTVWGIGYRLGESS